MKFKASTGSSQRMDVGCLMFWDEHAAMGVGRMVNSYWDVLGSTTEDPVVTGWVLVSCTQIHAVFRGKT